MAAKFKWICLSSASSSSACGPESGFTFRPKRFVYLYPTMSSKDAQMPALARHRQGRVSMSQHESAETPPAGESAREVELAQIREALRGLKYGSVNIIVQDGVVVQIDRL